MGWERRSFMKLPQLLQVAAAVLGAASAGTRWRWPRPLAPILRLRRPAPSTTTIYRNGLTSPLPVHPAIALACSIPAARTIAPAYTISLPAVLREGAPGAAFPSYAFQAAPSWRERKAISTSPLFVLRRLTSRTNWPVRSALPRDILQMSATQHRSRSRAQQAAGSTQWTCPLLGLPTRERGASDQLAPLQSQTPAGVGLRSNDNVRRAGAMQIDFIHRIQKKHSHPLGAMHKSRVSVDAVIARFGRICASGKRTRVSRGHLHASTAPTVHPAVPASIAQCPSMRAGLQPKETSDRQGGGERGDLYMDGSTLGRWLIKQLNNEVVRPLTGIMAVDLRATPSWGGPSLAI